VGVVDTADKHREYLREFTKKFEIALIEYSGVRVKLIHEKKLEAENLVSDSLENTDRFRISALNPWGGSSPSNIDEQNGMRQVIAPPVQCAPI
jgi:hypothetical protein